MSDSEGKACTPVSFGSFLIHVQTEIRGFYLTTYKDGQEKERGKQRDFKMVLQFFDQFEIVSFPWQNHLKEPN